ncbi:MAG: dihydropteroate synthase [Frankiales bacterium]|nr:dihydropteroate synthase [Frankiales bacterium]
MISIRGKQLPETSLVMAIVNRTPDSFFDKGATYGLDAAVDRVAEVVEQGAHIVDIGGVKAAPGEDVPADEEARRVVELIAAVRDRHPDVVLSVDTYRAEVARRALEAGADLVNDAWQAPEPETARVAAEFGAGLVCTHAGHLPPRTRPHRVTYRDVVADVVQTLTGLADTALAEGVPREGILIDPGHDFGKSTRHSLQVTARTADLVATGWPVLMALSRKDFVGEVLDLLPDERLEGTLAATAVCAFQGARVFRVHDVPATLRVLRMVDAIRGTVPPVVNVRGLA